MIPKYKAYIKKRNELLTVVNIDWRWKDSKITHIIACWYQENDGDTVDFRLKK